MKKTTKKTAKAVLVLRICSANMTSCGGFKWPKRGPVSAPDWIDNYKCGNGLHGWLWGEGDGSIARAEVSNAKWLVVRVLASEIRHGAGELIGKCKFPRGCVVHCGNRESATEYLIEHGANEKAIIGGTAMAGYRGTATAGDYGTATAGHRGIATVGDRGTATAGDRGTATAKYGGTARAGHRGTARADYWGTATAGDNGTATAGYCGTATVGHEGTATAGNYGTATAGCGGTAQAGDSGMICIKYYDVQTDRYRMAVAYVGENGIMPNRKYTLNNSDEFVEVK